MKIFSNSELRNLSREFRNSQGRDLKLNANSKYVKKLSEAYNLQPQGGSLTISKEEKAALKSRIEQEHGINNLLDTDAIVDLNRIEEAKRSQNEKSGASAPNKNVILVKGMLPLKSGIYNVPNNLSVRVHLDEIELSEIEQVLFVENLAAFDSAFKDIDFDIENVLVVYRGHGIDARAVLELLKLAPKYQFAVTAWTDYDPSGINIAFSIPNLSAFLVPLLENVPLGKVNQPNLYLDQYRSLNKVEALAKQYELASIKDLLARKLAITQEHQIAYKLPLAKVCLKKLDNDLIV